MVRWNCSMAHIFKCIFMSEMRCARITEVLFFFFSTRVGQVITIKAKVSRAFSTSMEVRGSLFFLLPVGAHLFIVYRGQRRKPGIT